MDPGLERWSKAEEDNMHVPVEMPTLEDTPIQVSLASGTDVETTQDQGVPNDIPIQEDAQISTQPVELVDFQSVPALPVERAKTQMTTEESEGLQDDFI